MSLRLGIVVVAVAAALGAACGASRAPEQPYAPLRQARVQEIPGTFGYELAPAGGGEQAVDPSVAYRGLLGAGAKRDVTLTLADVRNDTEGVVWGPAWVYLTRDLCYFSAKGDFVSPSRSGNGDGCTPANMLVQVVDAQTGKLVAAFDAYDATGFWSPARAGGAIS